MPNKLVAEMPWEVHASVHGNSASVRGARGEEIAMNIYGPHAELVVLAVNSHAKLLGRLIAQVDSCCGVEKLPTRDRPCIECERSRLVIAEAEGKNS